MPFFDPQGNPIDIDEFVKIYEPIYYYRICCNNKSGFENSLRLEEKVQKILDKQHKSPYGTLSLNQICEILEWKIGSVNENDEYGIYRTKIDVQKIIKVNYNEKNLNCMLRELCDVDGMGYVYSITVIYFLSGGKFPIYDKFAHLAVNAILDKEGKKPGEKINDLKPVSDVKFETAYERYENFCGGIREIFGGKYETDRKYDRALWAYGHLFV